MLKNALTRAGRRSARLAARSQGGRRRMADWWRGSVIYQIYPRSFQDFERRRHRRPQRASPSGCPTSPTSASTRSGCRRSSPRRWPTWATTSPTIPTSTRSSARSPTSTRWSRAPTSSGSRSSSTRCCRTPRPAPVLQGEPVEPRQPQGRLVRLGRPEARRHAAEQLAVGLRRPGLGLGRPAPAVLSAQLPRRAAGLQLPQPRGAGLAALDHALLARARRRRLPPRHRQLLLPRQAAARRPGRLPPQGPSRRPTPTTCSTTSSRRTSRRTSASSSGCASSSTSTRRAPWSARWARATTRSG